MQSTVQSYGAKDIQVLEGLEGVRRRPGMYIGGTDEKGLHQLIQEVVDNSVDEAMAGACDEIVVTLCADGTVRVADNGRGIPVERHKVGKSTLEVVMTRLHAGGKFDKRGYKVSGGLHGVGVSAVCALSSWMRVEVRRDGKLYRQEYSEGKPTTQVDAVGSADGTGTTTAWRADEKIFGRELEYSFEILAQRLREMAFLNKGLRITLLQEATEETPEREVTFYFEGGISSFVRYLNQNKTSQHPKPIYMRKEFSHEGEFSEIEIALQYTDDFTENILCFANAIYNPDGGTHLTGFRTALTRTLND